MNKRHAMIVWWQFKESRETQLLRMGRLSVSRLVLQVTSMIKGGTLMLRSPDKTDDATLCVAFGVREPR